MGSLSSDSFRFGRSLTDRDGALMYNVGGGILQVPKVHAKGPLQRRLVGCIGWCCGALGLDKAACNNMKTMIDNCIMTLRAVLRD